MKWLGKTSLPVVLVLATQAGADPSLECSFEQSAEVEIANCLIETEERANLAMELVLGYVRDAAFDMDETTGQEVALPALNTAQDAWAAYRDKACEYRGAIFQGGAGADEAIRSCKIELTRARTAALSALLN